MAEQKQSGENTTLNFPGGSESVFVLITQCLQNSFFLEGDCQLCLPMRTVKQMLLGSHDDEEHEGEIPEKHDLREFEPQQLQKGPLYRFLDTVINNPSREEALHVVNLKDWHTPTSNYDQERRTYGTHCEANTYGAECLSGFENLLEPWHGMKNKTEAAKAANAHLSAMTVTGYPTGGDGYNNIYYEVRSDTLFDFQPQRQGQDTLLKRIFDKIMSESKGKRIHVIVIGVYTDIKIMTLLTAIRSLYQVDNLIMSDVLTASPTLERHLAGLDYCDKVLKVEIIHSLNDLAAQVSTNSTEKIDVAITERHPDFRHYRSYYHDKQNVLAFQDDKLAEYIDLSRRQSNEVYRQVFRSNKYLQIAGFVFLILTFVAAILNMFYPEQVRVELVVITGGLSLSQLLFVFFTMTSKNMQSNLYGLVRLQNYLEAYSTIAALLRHYFTRPELLQMREKPDKMLSLLEQQIHIFDMFAEQMNKNFGSIKGEDIPDDLKTDQPNKTAATIGGMPVQPETMPSAENPASGQTGGGSPTSAG